MDVVLAPDFARSKRVYLSYSTAGAGGKGVVLARGTLTGNPGAEQLTGVAELFRATPFVEGNEGFLTPLRPRTIRIAVDVSY